MAGSKCYRCQAAWTVEHVLDFFRIYGKDTETLNAVYVTDERGRLIDDIRMREILRAPVVAPRQYDGATTENRDFHQERNKNGTKRTSIRVGIRKFLDLWRNGGYLASRLA